MTDQERPDPPPEEVPPPAGDDVSPSTQPGAPFIAAPVAWDTGVRVGSLRDWYRVQRATYTDAALRSAALAAGYSSEEFDTARRTVDLAPGTGPGPRGVGASLATVLIVLAIVAIYGLSAALAVAFAGPSSYYTTSGDRSVLLIYALAMVIGGLFSIYRVVRTPTRGAWATSIGVGLVISIAVFFGLGGLCLVGLSTA